MKILTTRIQQKHDIAANWEKSTLIPLAGEIIVYDDRYIDDNFDVKIVATAVRYKIGDGVTPVNKLPFVDTVDIAAKVKALTSKVDNLTAVTSGALTAIDGTILLTDNEDGSKAISVAIAPVAGNALTAVEGGLFVPSIIEASQCEPGEGIEITDNKVSVKLADITHGLTAVDGALTISLATTKSDGAMSKEDKAFIESIPEVYETRKYEIAYKPAGTVVDYREKEIRILCPVDTDWQLQNSGENADKNSYYIGFKAYAPKGAVGFKEDLAEAITDNTLYYFENNEFAGTDKHNRNYSIVWLPAARYVDNAWSYFGAKSTTDKYIGWYYTVEWYSEEGNLLSTDTIRINLSNEACHNNINTFYGENKFASDVDTLKNSVKELQEKHNWVAF